MKTSILFFGRVANPDAWMLASVFGLLIFAVAFAVGVFILRDRFAKKHAVAIAEGKKNMSQLAIIVFWLGITVSSFLWLASIVIRKL